ncbi:MAG: Stringent starvation protein B, partial [Parafilimonas terrae]|nr:Stringent starvation protein B [Parafilimonas terrae]
VSFRTEAPGVRMSQALREKYPQDMTIVLQHQFWDLNVTEHAFEVGLSFSGVPERLLVPFEALSGFFDPSVQFGLKFDLSEAGETPEEANAAPAKAGPRGAGSEPGEVRPKGAGLATIGAAAPKGLPAPAASTDKGSSKPDEKAPRPAAKKEGEEAGAEVVSLDAFRKKS